MPKSKRVAFSLTVIACSALACDPAGMPPELVGRWRLANASCCGELGCVDSPSRVRDLELEFGSFGSYLELADGEPVAWGRVEYGPRTPMMRQSLGRAGSDGFVPDQASLLRRVDTDSLVLSDANDHGCFYHFARLRED